jgi:hypothetical protein
MNKKINILVFILLFTGIVKAQDNTCLEDVKRVYTSWAKQVNENSGNTIYLKYSTEITTGKIGDLKKNKSIIEVISNKSNSYFSTTGTEIFQDAKHTVSIFSDKKTIVINGFAGENYKKEKLGQFEIFKDSVFSHLEVQECKTITLNSKVYKKVILKTNSYGAKLLKIKTITFLLDENLNTVKEIKVNYVAGHRFYAMKISILKQNLNYSSKKLTKVATAKVLGSNGKLLPKYMGYRLLDNRNKKL